MKKVFCGKIKEGQDLEFLIGDDIVLEHLDDWDCNGQLIHLRYTVSNQPIDPNTVIEQTLKTIYGELDADHGCIPFSEWTGFVGWDDTLSVDGHDLVKELLTFEGKYCYLELECNGDND